MKRLGVNIDHVATVRNARGEFHPDPYKAALFVKKKGADSITIHLREDRRHIRDLDAKKICSNKKLLVNLEISTNNSIVKNALKIKPKFICIVPENRNEITTEGGLDVKSNMLNIERLLKFLSNSKIEVACFIEPNFNQIDSLKSLGIKTLEFHTGSYADARTEKIMNEKLSLIKEAAQYAEKLGFDCHAGHGLNYDNVYNIASIKEIKELNIGHFIIGEAIFSGLKNSISKMKEIINSARK